MKQKVPEQVFTERSRRIFSGMGERAKKCHMLLPFDLDRFRIWVSAQFDPVIGATVRCYYSNVILTAETFFVDHKTPITRGGSFALDNLAICSEKENLRKGMMTEKEYRTLRDYIYVSFPPVVQESIWRRLEVGDVQRFSHFRRQKAMRAK